MIRRLAFFTFAFALTTASQAQTPATPQPGLGGPVIAGVCLLSREAVFGNAKVSVAANARLQQISQEAQAEVDALRKPIDDDLAAFGRDAARLSADQRKQREEALNGRLLPVRALADQRSREVELTRTRMIERISDAAQPAIAQVYASKRCGLLFDRNSALGGNFANDLTADVVKELDARIQTISFNRETIPVPAPAAR